MLMRWRSVGTRRPHRCMSKKICKTKRPEAERAAVVAWLREQAEEYDRHGAQCTAWRILDLAAGVERGEVHGATFSSWSSVSSNRPNRSCARALPPR